MTEETKEAVPGEQRARCLIEVQAGLLPGTPMLEYTKQWVVTERDWELMQSDDAELRGVALSVWDTVHGSAREYAARLMNPRQMNWVRLEWIWL